LGDVELQHLVFTYTATILMRTSLPCRKHLAIPVSSSLSREYPCIFLSCLLIYMSINNFILCQTSPSFSDWHSLFTPRRSLCTNESPFPVPLIQSHPSTSLSMGSADPPSSYRQILYFLGAPNSRAAVRADKQKGKALSPSMMWDSLLRLPSARGLRNFLSCYWIRGVLLSVSEDLGGRC